ETSTLEFREIHESDPGKIACWMAYARTLLELVPRGLGASHVREFLRPHFEIDAPTAERHFRWFVEILPDMGWLVDVDDTFGIIMEQLGCGLSHLEKIEIDHDAWNAEAALRNLISGESKSWEAFAKLRGVCKSDYWRSKLEADEGSEALYTEL